MNIETESLFYWMMEEGIFTCLSSGYNGLEVSWWSHTTQREYTSGTTEKINNKELALYLSKAFQHILEQFDKDNVKG
jgi:hypothetical protein